MKKYMINFFVAAVSVMMCGAPHVLAKKFTESIQQGSVVKVNFRTRYEDVNEDVVNAIGEKVGQKKADAWTTRSRLSYQSGAWKGFGFTAEMDNVSEMTNNVDYRTAANDPANIDSAVIADPIGTELNQGFISYATFNNQIKYGRQRLVLDNSRFVGNVGWRQNEQTYDGISFTNKAVRYTNLTYAYIKNANRVFGEDNAALGDLNMNGHIVNASYAGFDAGKLVGYAYLLDVENPIAQTGLTSDSFGARWQGTVGEMFAYNLEYATQKDAGLNEAYSANYVLVDATYTLSRFSIGLGYELLGSDNGAYGFATPLATLHAFNGWADKFLTTPKDGLEDKYLNLGMTFAGAQTLLTYHKFDADFGGADYGDEIDFSISKKIGSVVLTAKYSHYSMGDAATRITDTNKSWVMADWNF